MVSRLEHKKRDRNTSVGLIAAENDTKMMKERLRGLTVLPLLDIFQSTDEKKGNLLKTSI